MPPEAADGGNAAPTSFVDIEGTRLWRHLENGTFQVVKGQYFVDRLAKGGDIQMRQDINRRYVWKGKDVLERWAEHGLLFLIAVSYAWLHDEHPDPNSFHLETLAAQVEHHRKRYAEDLAGSDIGIVLDYCCFSQPKLNDGVDMRTEEEKAQLKVGLEDLHVLYGHASICTWRLEQVPMYITRKYDDRGWTFFERSLTDAKPDTGELAPSVRVLRTGNSGAQASARRRGPPLTPERFERELRLRGGRAHAKGVRLFAHDEDLALVRRKYREAFAQLARTTVVLDYADASFWEEEETSALLDALPSFRELHFLVVRGLRPEVGGQLTKDVADLLEAGACPKMEHVALWGAGPDAGGLLERVLATRWEGKPVGCLDATSCFRAGAGSNNRRGTTNSKPEG